MYYFSRIIFLALFVSYYFGEKIEKEEEPPKFENHTQYQGYVASEFINNLTKDVFGDYEKEVSPFTEGIEVEKFRKRNDTNSTENVFSFIKKWSYAIRLMRLKLIDVDEPKEQMTVVMEVLQFWQDSRLQWNFAEYGDIMAITTRLEKVWSPPFTVYGASEVVEHRDQNYRTAKVLHTGLIVVHIPLKTTTTCKMELDDFPFDTQICDIRIAVPLYDSHYFDIGVSVGNHLLEACVLGNSAWDIFNITYGQELIIANNDIFSTDKMAVFKLHLKRNPMFYMYMIVLPTFIINAISIAGVFLKNTEKMDRLTVGLTHIMTMTFILALIADKLPKTETIPLLGKYIIFGLCTMIVAMTFSTYLKKISSFLGGHLAKTRSRFGQKLRRFIGTPLRIICVIIFQAINLLAGIYLLYRLISFENEYDNKHCHRPKPTMDIIPERFVNGTIKEL